MKGLLIKDLRLLLGQKRFFVLFLFIAVMLNFNSDGSFVIGYMTFVCSVYALSTISYDENENGYPFLMTLPVLRKTYAREKYVFSLLFSSSAWVIAVVVALAFKICRKVDFLPADFFLEAAVFIPIYFVLLAVMLPFQFKFGGEKGRIAMLVAFGAGFFVVYFSVKGLQKVGIDVEKIIASLPTLHRGMLILSAFVVAIAAALLSGGISSRIMCKKEF